MANLQQTIRESYAMYWQHNIDVSQLQYMIRLLDGLKPRGVGMAMADLKDQPEPPTALEIIAQYKVRKAEQDAQAKATADQDELDYQQRMGRGQHKCLLCDNDGRVIIDNGMARCICSHGRDVNKFHDSQLDPNTSVRTKSGRSNYIPTALEHLGEENFAIWRAEMTAKRMKHVDVDKAKAMLEALRVA